MLVAGGEIFTSLSTGVIDAAEWVGPYHDHIMGLHKAAKYYYSPGFHEPGPNLELMVNQKKWAQLPASLQQIVRTCSAELDRNMLAEWVAKDAEYLEKFKNDKQIEILEYPQEVQRQMKIYADEVLDELAIKDPMSKKVLNSFKTFQTRYEDHYRTVALSYWQNKLAKS